MLQRSPGLQVLLLPHQSLPGGEPEEVPEELAEGPSGGSDVRHVPASDEEGDGLEGLFGGSDSEERTSAPATTLSSGPTTASSSRRQEEPDVIMAVSYTHLTLPTKA